MKKILDSRGVAHLVPLLVLMGLFIAGGLYYVLQIRAATPAFSAEAENMTVSPAAAIPPKTVLNPSADTWLSAMWRNSNYGRDTLLHADFGYGSELKPEEAETAQIRFNLTNTPNSIYSAKLRMKVANPTVGKVEITEQYSYSNPSWGFTWPNSWNEYALTYNNIPPWNSVLASFEGTKYPANSWVEVDVTPWAQAHVGQEMSMAVFTRSTDGFHVYSRESLYKPELVLTFGGSTTAHVYPTNDSGASNGKAMKFYTNGTISTTIATNAETDQLTIYGRGDQCMGAPFMIAKVNGEPIFANSSLGYVFDNTSYNPPYWGRKFPSNRVLPAGNHRVEISFPNDLYATCDRNAIIDKVELSKQY